MLQNRKPFGLIRTELDHCNIFSSCGTRAWKARRVPRITNFYSDSFFDQNLPVRTKNLTVQVARSYNEMENARKPDLSVKLADVQGTVIKAEVAHQTNGSYAASHKEKRKATTIR